MTWKLVLVVLSVTVVGCWAASSGSRMFAVQLGVSFLERSMRGIAEKPVSEGDPLLAVSESTALTAAGPDGGAIFKEHCTPYHGRRGRQGQSRRGHA
jgi:hypothetical protein